jgi:hypothetical protein
MVFQHQVLIATAAAKLVRIPNECCATQGGLAAALT